jgi:hypothetical protein
MAKGEKRIKRLSRKKETERRDIRLEKQRGKVSEQFTRREIKKRKIGRKAANTLAEAKHQGTLGTKKGIRKMTRLGEKYNRQVSRPSFSMTPGSREVTSPGITRKDDKTNMFNVNTEMGTIKDRTKITSEKNPGGRITGHNIAERGKRKTVHVGLTGDHFIVKQKGSWNIDTGEFTGKTRSHKISDRKAGKRIKKFGGPGVDQNTRLRNLTDKKARRIYKHHGR